MIIKYCDRCGVRLYKDDKDDKTECPSLLTMNGEELDLCIKCKSAFKNWLYEPFFKATPPNEVNMYREIIHENN